MDEPKAPGSTSESFEERARKRWLPRWLRIALWTILATGVAMGVGGLLFLRSMTADLPDVQQLKQGYDPPQVTRIRASDGTLLGSAFTERRTVVEFDTLSDATKLAFLAAEDARFYEHEGLNYLGVFRALLANIRAGRTVQGGSTITQQVVKNVLLDSRRTLRRKVRETVLALRLEQQLSKDEIFSLYLNHIYLGHGRYGIEEASRYYFGKRAAQLEGDEAALLAGLVASPERFSPRKAPEQALRRRSYVLHQMLQKGFVTQEFFERFQSAPLELAPEVDVQSTLAPEFVQAGRDVLRQVQANATHGEAYTVWTTLEPELQVAARHAVRSGLAAYEERHKLRPPYVTKKITAWGKPFEGKPRAHRIYVGTVVGADDRSSTLRVRVGEIEGQVMLSEEDRYNPKHLAASEFAKPGAVLRVRLLEKPRSDSLPKLRLELGPQAALAAIDVRTRKVVALVGSYEALAGGLDRSRKAKRQPGSAFKPFVFSSALHEREVTAATVLSLSKRGRGVHGEEPPFAISVRQALAHSNNEAAEQLLMMAGPRRVVEWAHRLGIESRLEPNLSLALGAYEVSPLELSNAYATIASGGMLDSPVLVRSVEDGAGKVVYQSKSEPRRVLDADEAYLLASLMQSVVRDGTGRRARRLGRPVAAKTGTSNEARDAWFAGFTTELSVAVWVGFDDNLPLGKHEGGARTAGPIFVEFMQAAHEGLPPTEFPRPPGVVQASVDPATGLLARPGSEEALVEEFLAGTAPEQLAPLPMTDSDAEMPYMLGYP